jgi:hypothetical protein
MRIIGRGTIFSAAETSTQRVACYPALARLSCGRILCTFRIGQSKDGADEKVRMMQSSDEGQSWQSCDFGLDTRLNGVPGSMATATVIETAPNELLALSSWINRENPGLPISHPTTAGCLELRLVKSHSSDGGESWSALEEIAVPFAQPEVSGPVIALNEPGHLLLPMENQKHYDDPNPIDEKCYVMLSRDGGKSWPEWAIVAHDHPARKFWCNRVTKLTDGRLACVSWTFDNATEQDLPLHITFGSSDGRQWSTPASTGVAGQVSYLFPYDESTLLMATSHRETPAGIRLRQSTDGGKSWEKNGLVVFDAESQSAKSGGDLGSYYQQMTNYTFGWSPMLRLKDGSILLAYFAGVGDAIDICYAKINCEPEA